jgi:hypothetical protein
MTFSSLQPKIYFLVLIHYLVDLNMKAMEDERRGFAID